MGNRARDAATESRYGSVAPFAQETRLVGWNAGSIAVSTIERVTSRARPPRNNILTYEVSAFFQSHGFSWRPLTFRLPTSPAPAATLGRCSFCCLSRHRYIHKAAQRVYLFLPFSTSLFFFPPSLPPVLSSVPPATPFRLFSFPPSSMLCRRSTFPSTVRIKNRA